MGTDEEGGRGVVGGIFSDTLLALYTVSSVHAISPLSSALVAKARLKSFEGKRGAEITSRKGRPTHRIPLLDFKPLSRHRSTSSTAANVVHLTVFLNVCHFRRSATSQQLIELLTSGGFKQT